MQDDGRLTINIPEFAKWAGISKNQAYSLAREDRLGVKVIHLGKRLVLSRKSVLAWLQGEDTQGGNENGPEST